VALSALTAVTASTASEGSPVAADHAGAPAAAEGSSTPASVTTWAANRPHSFDAQTAEEVVRATQAPAGASEVGRTGARGSADPEVAPGSVVLRAGPLHSEASASTPSATASALNASAVTAGSTGSSRSSAVSAQEGSTVAAFPDAEGGIASSGLDIGDLAASISRPLAAGGGDYSVQVSLHPPELGQVRALLSLQGDVLHVTLTPEHASGFDALSDALPTLHDQLAGGGVEVHVSLGQPGDQAGGDDGATAKAGSVVTTSIDDTSQPLPLSAVPITSGDPGRIHLIL
jgi:flagellar hook-length control protein FliK